MNTVQDSQENGANGSENELTAVKPSVSYDVKQLRIDNQYLTTQLNSAYAYQEKLEQELIDLRGTTQESKPKSEHQRVMSVAVGYSFLHSIVDEYFDVADLGGIEHLNDLLHFFINNQEDEELSHKVKCKVDNVLHVSTFLTRLYMQNDALKRSSREFA